MQKRTVITHFRNESYLLPWWLKHHRLYFDEGILIDYNSTDDSADICRTIVPEWKLVKSKNEFFQAHLCDEEIMKYETSIEGYRIALTMTEFILGNFNTLNHSDPHRIVVKSYIMADPIQKGYNYPTYDVPLYKQNFHGYFDSNYRSGRLMSNYPNRYNPGRHFFDYSNEDFIILFYAFAPWNEKTIQRKNQIQENIPDSDYGLGRGLHHRTNPKELEQRWESHARNTQDISGLINKF
jgi:hypothetical protein